MTEPALGQSLTGHIYILHCRQQAAGLGCLKNKNDG
jgi:hypothetical protein